jgi:AcrR family transcriptional regulator
MIDSPKRTLILLASLILRSTPWVVKSERSFYFGQVPRVSEDHLAARRQQILDAARVCFLRNGFHATSIQDVIAEAGLSVGAVYRYFPSKTGLINATAGQFVGEVEATLRAVATDESVPLPEAMARAVDLMDRNLGTDGMMRLGVQLWAEALRDPAIGEFVAGAYRGLRATFVALAGRAQASGELPAGADPQAVGAALFSLLLGFGLQRLLTGSPDRSTYQAGVRALIGWSLQ